ncbi:MAG: family 16 glycosylhydrolase [Clostridiales bacterium]|nr:family 16 glycosylhydrolase [Clostridiales bacterium]
MKKTGFTRVLSCILVILTVLLFGGCELLGATSNNGNPAVYIYQSVIELEVGQTVQLQVISTDDSEITWVSGDESVATVVKGLVMAVGVGESVITALGDSAMSSCTVKVKPKQQQSAPPVDSDTPDVSGSGEVFVLVINAFTLGVGESVTLQATSTSNDTISWSSSVPTVATVNNGVVTALSVGETVITAQTSKASAQCTITVTFSSSDDAAKPGYRLAWRDEFNGTALDTDKWGYQLGIQDHYGTSTGPVFWGNEELQYYTQQAVTVSDGSLRITATRQDMPDGRRYSSARILTRDKASWTYGYFEARMKTPTGQGMWPAFWMLPQPSTTSNSNNIYGSWPASGEIDIMEARGRLLNRVDTTLHFGGAWNEHDYAGTSTILVSNTDEWHTYALEWTDSDLTWYIDGRQVFTVNKSRWWSQDKSNKGQSMPFDQPFYILLNLAVGGNYDSKVEPDETFTSATMYVDYVRVYEKI